MEHPFAQLPGAVTLPADEASAPVHYGAPLREQRHLARGDAVVALDDLAVLRITGSDRASWVDSLTSQRIRDISPGESTETLLLTPEGRIEHILLVTADEDALWVLTPREDAAALLAFLNRMRFMLDVAVERRSDLTPVAWFEPVPGTSPLPSPLIPDVRWRAHWDEPPAHGVSYRPGGAADGAGPHPDSWPAVIGLANDELVAGIARAAAAGVVRVAGTDAWRALRIAAWRPDRSELDTRSLPHELDWLRTAVHLNKGCYRGQETVAKVHNLGHPPRRLALVHLDGEAVELPRVPAALRIEGDTGRIAGVLTSVALHMDEGPIGLALLRRTVSADATLVVDAGSPEDGIEAAPVTRAAQTVIVSPDAGRAVDVPRELRRNAVR